MPPPVSYSKECFPPAWIRHSRSPSADEWQQTNAQARSAVNHCGRRMPVPFWVWAVLHINADEHGQPDFEHLLQRMEGVPEPPATWPPQEEPAGTCSTMERLALLGLGSTWIPRTTCPALPAPPQLLAIANTAAAAAATATQPRQVARTATMTELQPQSPAIMQNAACSSKAAAAAVSTTLPSSKPPPPRPQTPPAAEVAGSSSPPHPKPPPPPPSTAGIRSLPQHPMPVPLARQTADAATQTTGGIITCVGNPAWIRFIDPTTAQAWWWNNSTQEWWWEHAPRGFTRYCDPASQCFYWARDVSVQEWNSRHTDVFWELNGDDE